MFPVNATKMNLCRRVSKKCDVPVTDIKPIVETFLDEIIKVLSEGQRIEIRGFGSYNVKIRRARIGRNPRTGEVVDIPEYVAPCFKFSGDAQKTFDKYTSKEQKT